MSLPPLRNCSRGLRPRLPHGLAKACLQQGDKVYFPWFGGLETERGRKGLNLGLNLNPNLSLRLRLSHGTHAHDADESECVEEGGRGGLCWVVGCGHDRGRDRD